MIYIVRALWEEAGRKISLRSDDAEIQLQQYLADKGYRIE